MPFVVRREDGKFLGRGTGSPRHWVDDLDDADTWKSAGRAKVSFNHVIAPLKWSNDHNGRLNARNGTNHPLYTIPAFEALEVIVSLKEPA